MFQKSEVSPRRLAVVAALAGLSAAPLMAQACAPEAYVGTICTVAFNWCPEGTLPANGSLQSISQYQALYSLISTYYGGDGRTTFGLPDLRSRAPVGAYSAGGSFSLTPLQIANASGAEATQLTANNVPPHVHPVGIPKTAFAGTTTVAITNLPVTGATLTGTVTVNALNGDAAPTGATNVPSSTKNTIGKNGTANMYYAPSTTTPVAVPVTNTLAVSGGTVSGTATANTMPANDVMVNSGLNAGGTAVNIVNPRLAVTYCIVTNGIYPSRP